MSDQKCDNPDSVRSRRAFLRTALAAGSGAAVVAATSSAAVAAVDSEAAAEPEAPASGYRETRHIRDYYQSTAL